MIIKMQKVDPRAGRGARILIKESDRDVVESREKLDWYFEPFLPMWISEFADKKSTNNEGHLYLKNNENKKITN